MDGMSLIQTELPTNARSDMRVGAGSGCAKSVVRFRTVDGNFGVFAGRVFAYQQLGDDAVTVNKSIQSSR